MLLVLENVHDLKDSPIPTALLVTFWINIDRSEDGVNWYSVICNFIFCRLAMLCLHQWQRPLELK